MLPRCLALLLALPLAACASSSSPEPPAPEVALTGTYTYEHPVMIFDGDDWVESPATDELVLIERGDSLFAAISLVRTNAHLCGYRGMLAREERGWVRRTVIDSYSGADTCTLALTVTGDTLTLSDSSGVCRHHHCGLRAYLDGAQFARGTRTPDTTLSER